MLALAVRYLTGYSVATDISSREKAEWPPHPGRVFMAMAAAMFETDGDEKECAALQWLETNKAPAMWVSSEERRSFVIHYVPVNDSSSPISDKKVMQPLQYIPIGRNRQPRTFPRVRPQHDTVYLVWPDADPSPDVVDSLGQICAKVTRIGHSTSLVQMWVEKNPPPWNLEPAEFGEKRLRVVGEGMLQYLESTFNMGNGVRPTISQWQAYKSIDGAAVAQPTRSGVFDPEIMVLTIQDGPVAGLESTWPLLTALQKTILATCNPLPEWLSGHTTAGEPSQDPHLALFPLAFVGQDYADGHIMGIGLAFPKHVPPKERGQALRGLLYDERGMPKPVLLQAGTLGCWSLARETRPSPAVSLDAHTWTQKSDTWASVTPIVLDRHPKVERVKDRERWTLEVAQIIGESCERQGLPKPAVDVDKTSWNRGAPRAVGGKSVGFPLMPVKEGQPKRQQVHAWLQFPEPVEGPLLLGAGRYRGYGLCRPWKRRR